MEGVAGEVGEPALLGIGILRLEATLPKTVSIARMLSIVMDSPSSTCFVARTNPALNRLDQTNQHCSM